MINYCLKFKDQKEALSVFTLAGMVVDGTIISATHDYALDEVGAIVASPSITDKDGNIITPAVMDSGYWFLMCTEFLPKELLNYVAKPTRAFRVWADTPEGMADQCNKAVNVEPEIKEKQGDKIVIMTLTEAKGGK